MKRTTILWFTVSILVASGVVVLAMSVQKKNTVGVEIYHAGQKYTLPFDQDAVQDLVRHCEEQLRSADSILRMAVSDHTVRGLKEKETVIEISFRKPKTFSVGFSNQKIEVRRFLIPITGELAGAVTTIFHGSGSKYASGPLRNSRGTSPISTIVERLGILPE